MAREFKFPLRAASVKGNLIQEENTFFDNYFGKFQPWKSKASEEL